MKNVAIKNFCHRSELAHHENTVIGLSRMYPRYGAEKCREWLERYSSAMSYGKMSYEETQVVFMQWATEFIAMDEPGKRWDMLHISQAYAREWVEKYDTSCGRGGRRFELEMCIETGTYRTRWGNEQECDSCSVQLYGYDNVTIEVKSNAGDAMNIIAKEPDVVVYRLKGASHQWGPDLEARITTGKHFIEVLQACNGLNYSTGKAMIQANMKAVWQAIEKLPLWKGVEHVYTIEELEGGH